MTDVTRWRHKSRDGLASSADPAAIALWDEITARHASEQTASSEQLRALGVKMEHPDDGWVNRDRNSILPAYPRFDLRPEAGDLIALGWPWSGYRLVRCTKVEHEGILIPRTVYYFEETGQCVKGSRS